MSDIAVIDAEMIAALKVLRGDSKKDDDRITKEYSDELISKIIIQLAEQTQAVTAQNAAVVKAIEEQTAVLKKVSQLLQQKQKTTVVVVNKDDKSGRSVASTAAETEMSTISEDAEVVQVVSDPKPTGPKVVKGPWGFVESESAAKRRSRIKKSSGSFKLLPKNTPLSELPPDAFAPITNESILKGEDALFGNITATGSELAGDSFGKCWESMKVRTDQYGKCKAPRWSKASKQSVRNLIPRLSIDGETKIAFDSGIYYLTVKYENPHSDEDSSKSVEAAIIVGEICFDSRGGIMTSGADVKKMLAGEPIEEPPAGTAPKWHAAKASAPWKHGDILKFKIDTYTKSVGFTVTAAGEESAKAGWILTNIMTMTNRYRKDIEVCAYCGGISASVMGAGTFSGVKLTVLDSSVNSSASVSSISVVEETEEEAPAEEETPAEEEAPAEEEEKEEETADEPTETKE